MREYIVNLTNNLIGDNGFDRVYRILDDSRDPSHEKFMMTVFATLESRSLIRMSPETLGKILCSIEPGDLIHEELPKAFMRVQNSTFARHLVAHLLTVVILGRLDERQRWKIPNVPPYTKGSVIEVEVRKA